MLHHHRWENRGEYLHTENQVYVLHTQDKAMRLQCLYDLMWLNNLNQFYLEINLLHVILLSSMSIYSWTPYAAACLTILTYFLFTRSCSQRLYFISTIKKKEQRIINMPWSTILFTAKNVSNIYSLTQSNHCSWFLPKNPEPVTKLFYELPACSDFFFFPGEVEQQ